MATETALGDGVMADLAAAHAARWVELDPLLAAPPPLTVGAEDTLLTVAWPGELAAVTAGGSADGVGEPGGIGGAASLADAERAASVQPAGAAPAASAGAAGFAAASGIAGEAAGLAGVGAARVRRVDVTSLDGSWSAAEVYALAARVAGPAPAAALDELLARWRETLPERVGEDSAATVMWPSRDTAAVPALIRHGLSPLVVIAARPAGRAEPATVPPGVTLRRAELADLADIVALRLATIRYDAQFGAVSERPATADRLREHAERFFTRDDPWSWVATRDGAVLGMVAVDQPPHADGLANHQHLDQAGVALTLLHHALPNPLSTPFYGRHGYRPLYTFWQTQPATTLR
jgi:hypothetical protein